MSAQREPKRFATPQAARAIPCRFCGAPIRWAEHNGESIPTQANGARHVCRKRKELR